MIERKGKKKDQHRGIFESKPHSGLLLLVFLLTALLLSAALALPIALEQTAEKIEHASEESLTNADKVLSSYEHSFSQLELLIQEKMAASQDVDELEAYLKSMDDTLLGIEGESYDGVYLYYQGRYIYSWDTPFSVYEERGYDARTRPWYIGAIKAKGDVFITDPYMSYANNYMLATLSRLQADGETVIAYDIKMTDLQSCIDGFRAIDGAEVFVNDGGDNLISATNTLYLGENLFQGEDQLRGNVTAAERDFAEAAAGEQKEKAKMELRAAKATQAFSEKNAALLEECSAQPQSLHFDWDSRSFGYLYQFGEYSCFVVLPLLHFVLSEYSLWLILMLLILGLELVIRIVILRRRNMKAMQESRRALEAALLAADNANAAKSQFLSRMSHDMRTPLNAVLGFTTLARDESADGEEVTEYLCKIDESGHYLLGLINDVLDMSKIEDGKLELHPSPYHYEEFHNTICTIMEPQASEKGVDFVMHCDISVPKMVLIDKLRLQQIFVNLLNNAIKFTPQGGHVIFLVVGDGISADGTMPITFTVKDDGMGMGEDFLKNKLYAPFEQECRGGVSTGTGTGLGLSIAKKLVEQMGGSIHCESTLGRGTTFTVCLSPQIIDTSSEGITKQEVSYDCLNSAHILLCEDNPLNTIIFRKLLEKVGCLVDSVENGRLGIERFEASEIRSYDAILMDIRMPLIGGLEATRIIRAMDRADAKTIPIIAISANAFEEDVSLSLEAGMTAHLAKPVEPQKLYQMLGGLLSEDKE